MKNTARTAGGSRVLLGAASAIIVIAGLRAAQPLIIPFLIAVFLAIICVRPVIWLQRRRVPAVVAVILVVIVLMAVLSLFGAMVGGSVNEFTESIPRYQQRIQGLGKAIGDWVDRLPVEVPHIGVLDVVDPGALMGLLGSGLKAMVAALSNAVLVILTLVFMLLEAAGLPQKLRVALGPREGDLGRFAKVMTEVQRYLAIKTALSLATGALIAVWLAILGLDFALVWGLLAFLLNFIPTLGSVIAAVPAVLLAAVQLGVGPAILVLVGFVLVNMSIGNMLEPHLMGRRFGLSTLVVFVSLVFWGWLWGPVGMFLSVPLTMIAKILMENSDDLRWIAVMLDSGGATAEWVADGDGDESAG